jgi:hypothetical protein
LGNGVASSRQAVESSLKYLKLEFGDQYNRQKIEYALAYNETNGIALDVIQTVTQAGAQFDSNIMRWLNGAGIAPNGLSDWYQSYVLRAVVVVAEEIVDHANFYRNDILSVKKVVVFAHSQGNFYVNEAKQLLARQLPDDKMRSFTVFGTAVPSDNIGGELMPYLTNHRDFIQKVPQALPANWKLYRSDKTPAEDISPIQAYRFNAVYISEDFDIKPALIAGVRSQIDAAVQPIHSCEVYNKAVLSMVAGRYITTCGIEPDTRNVEVQITTDGMMIPEVGWLDLTGVGPSIFLNQQPEDALQPVSLAAFAGGGT